MMEKKKKNQKKNKEKDGQNRIFMFDFLNLIKISGTYRVDSEIE